MIPTSTVMILLPIFQKLRFYFVCVSFIPFFVFGFWSLLATKLQKYVIFVYILQDKSGKTEKNGKKRKENHTTKVTKIPKTKKRKYGMNKIIESRVCNNIKYHIRTPVNLLTT